MKKFLTKLIDRFYFPFIRKYIPIDLFRYAACGGANMVVFDWALYAVLYNFVFDRVNWDLGFVVISPHIAALLVSSPIYALTGFWLNKNIAFKESPLRESTQFFRYVMVYAVNLVISYAGLKLFVEVFHIYPTPSKILISLITIAFSFVMQKYFTFWRPKK